MRRLELRLEGDESRAITFKVQKIINAGRTARDPTDVKKHIQELREEGIKVSEEIPIFHPKIRDRITTCEEIEVLPNSQTSGEVEYVLILDEDNIFVTVGSDHTDRGLEEYNIRISKQMCLNVMSPEIWNYEDIKDHWDDLIMRAWIKRDGKRELYQEGKLKQLLSPEELLGMIRDKITKDLDGAVIYSGTFPVIGGKLSYSPYFEVALNDGNLGREIRHIYHAKPIDWIE